MPVAALSLQAAHAMGSCGCRGTDSPKRAAIASVRSRVSPRAPKVPSGSSFEVTQGGEAIGTAGKRVGKGLVSPNCSTMSGQGSLAQPGPGAPGWGRSLRTWLTPVAAPALVFILLVKAPYGITRLPALEETRPVNSCHSPALWHCLTPASTCVLTCALTHDPR